MANGFHTARRASRTSCWVKHLTCATLRNWPCGALTQWSAVARSQHQSRCDQIVTVLHWASSFQEGEHGRHTGSLAAPLVS